ncbi:hypothetical protein FRC19_009330 [Serendipita sp. 401]|nr:hypothetical protein FRC19_009330 [Serendipita sp. 401]
MLNMPPEGGLYGRFVVPPDTGDVYLLSSFGKKGNLVPPCPGPVPDAFKQQEPPLFIDGLLGPYDPRIYPQEWDPTRPWLGFHTIAKMSLTGHRLIEHWNPIDFFDVKYMRDRTFLGGSWNPTKIRLLLQRRKDAEHVLWSCGLLRSSANLSALKEEFGPSLPFIDNFELAHTTSWRSWMDGRDIIGNTLRYVSEVLALSRWLVEVRQQKLSNESATPQPTKYMGVWSGSINNDENWNFVLKSPLPVYSVLLVPPEHPLHSHALSTADGASFDADECRRVDSFTGSLPFGWVPKDHFNGLRHFPGSIHYTVPPQTRWNPVLPLSYQGVLSPNDVITLPPGTLRTSSSLTWMSYIFRERSIYRSSYSDVSQHISEAEEDQSRHWEAMVLTMERYLPSVDEVLHPATYFIQQRDSADQRTRYFVEHYKNIFFWVSPVKDEQMEDTSYNWPGYFHRIGPNDILLSDWPWPIIGESLPFFSPNLIFTGHAKRLMQDPRCRRVYLPREPGDDLLTRRQANLQPPPILRSIKELAGPIIDGCLRSYWLQSPADTLHELSPRFLPLDDMPPIHLQDLSFADSNEGDYESKFSISRFTANLRLRTTDSTDVSDDVASLTSIEQELEDDDNENSISDTTQLYFGAETQPDPLMDDKTSDSLMDIFSTHDSSPDPSASPPNPECPPNTLMPVVSETTEVSRSLISFIMAVALGNGTHQPPSTEGEILKRGPTTLAEVLQKAQMDRMFEDIIDARGSTTSICGVVEPQLESSSPSTSTDDLEMFLSSSSSSGEMNDSPDWNGLGRWLSPDVLNPEVGLPQPNLSQEIIEYRQRADAYVTYRLFKSTSLATDVVDHISHIQFTIPSQKPIDIYPMRIHNVLLAGKTTEDILPPFSRLASQQNFGDIIFLAVYFEADGLVTLDVAFRFPEDALALWVLKNGFLFEGHYWKVEPLKCMGSYIVTFPPRLQPSLYHHRCARLEKAIAQDTRINDPSMIMCTRQMYYLLMLLNSESVVNQYAVGATPTPAPRHVTPVKVSQKVTWKTMSQETFGTWMRHWNVPEGLPVRPPLVHDVPLQTEWPNIPIEMASKERNLAYRNSYRLACRKHTVWSSITLPTPPPYRNHAKDENSVWPLPGVTGYDALLHANEADTKIHEGFVDLWEWYEVCRRRVSDLRANPTGKYEALTQLPVPSTLEDRVQASRMMSFKTFELALMPNERFARLWGWVYILIWRTVAEICI